MSKILYINQTFGEFRAALVENGRVMDFFMERGKGLRVGNIYKGRVSKVLPGIGSAFVEIGHEKAAFLYLDKAWLPSGEEDAWEAHSGSPPKNVTIEALLEEGDEVLVQVSRESIGMKGPKVTRNITLPGRHIVYTPLVEHVGVSRQVTSDGERVRLEGILKDFCLVGKGAIARTFAQGQSASVIRADFDSLEGEWERVQERYAKIDTPGLCREEVGFAQRILRDIIDDDLEEIYVDTKDLLEEVEGFVGEFLPRLKGRCRLYREVVPIFDNFGIEEQVARALSNKIALRSGGAIHIDQTEALVSIDVNTGRFVGKRDLNETILKTNLEAVGEIARQLRLRNCGGIIVIDFIDMLEPEHREEVFEGLLNALKKDRAKYNVMPISGLGLVEMTRKQTRDTLVRLVCVPCSYCEGSGRVKSVSSVCYELLRDLVAALRKRGKGAAGRVHVYANPEVIDRLYDGEEFGFMETLEERWGGPFVVRSDSNYHLEQYDISCKD